MSLEKHAIHHPAPQTKVLIVVMDGVGLHHLEQNFTYRLLKGETLSNEPFVKGNAVNAALAPHLAHLYLSPYFRSIHAHGTFVGLPSNDDMGNSEVGHNVLGSGQIFPQGAKLVSEAIASQKLFNSPTWNLLIQREELKNAEKTLHLIGLLSDGNVHSHIQHLKAILEKAHEHGVKKMRAHTLLDGRDVSPNSAQIYLEDLESFLKQFPDAKIASGGGRSIVTMDRYESDWSIVERGYKAHVLGEGFKASSALEALTELRKQHPDKTDQDLPSFVICEQGQPIGKILDGDSVIFFNFRGDRAIEFTRAMTEESFDKFKRPFFPKVHYAGMMLYDGDLQIPKNYLVTPSEISGTMSELLSKEKIHQFACSETQKFGHVTYFWNGNRSEKFSEEFEHYVEVSSDRVPFEERPWMKCAEITDATIKAMKEDSFKVGRINFANGDMVGHTGFFQSTVCSVMSVDLCLGRLMKAAKETQTVLLITADHGNADEMYELDKKNETIVKDSHGLPRIKTSHTLRPVPLALYNLESLAKIPTLNKEMDAGLANIASTVFELIGYQPPKHMAPSLLDWTKLNIKEEKEFKPFSPIFV